MMLTVFLDCGVLGLLTKPQRTTEAIEATRWAVRITESGHRFVVPAVADYEVRRELERAGKTEGLSRLDTWNSATLDRFLPVSNSALRLAAKLWAQARNSGVPTADPKELDGDVIIAAQALDYGLSPRSLSSQRRTSAISHGLRQPIFGRKFRRSHFRKSRTNKMLSTPTILHRSAAVPSRVRVGVSLLIGCVAWIVARALHVGALSPLVGWDVSAVVLIAWISATVLRLDEAQTAAHASLEDPGRGVVGGLLLVASVISLVAVVFAIARAGSEHGMAKMEFAGLGILSVVLSWAVVHVVFTLRYARLFFHEKAGGIDFNADDPGEGDPTYIDFAYTSFTIGMTYQVSDTSLKTRELRGTALHHALLSYLFGTVIVAAAINLIAGLSK